MPEPAYSEQPLIGENIGSPQGHHESADTPPFPATIDVVPDGDRMTVTVRGELDLDACQQLRPGLNQALSRSVSGLDLDLTGVGFCDCSGLNLLLTLRERALDDGKTVVIGAVGPAVERVLHLADSRNHFAPFAPFTPPTSNDKNMTECADHDTDPQQTTDQDLHTLVAQLRRAMQTRPTIDLARGILMASFRLSPEAAWDVLVSASQNTNTKLHRLAGDLVSTIHGPELPESVRAHLAAAVAKVNAADPNPPAEPTPPAEPASARGETGSLPDH
ncbi:ANTAR domain-containing protein [Streptomyces sp. NPDC047117]|uniref:ANTAR domain-containing protein n=1 Tax=Streptomyces sp. NPDC047117 TaxID=3155379 RepID=UPI0033F31CB3